MAIDYRESESVPFSPPLTSGAPHSDQQTHQVGVLPIHCPGCARPIEVSLGLCGQRLLQAIMLQAEVLGTEIECHRCGHRFIYQRPGNRGTASSAPKVKKGTIQPLSTKEK
ncbi:MAG: hypothetical protein KDA80_16650 [Planctomycetaceae bacterium]|nr:hypothetical protein [Planctomycetaceae bacterium]